jgi:hypothetical protein
MGGVGLGETRVLERSGTNSSLLIDSPLELFRLALNSCGLSGIEWV